MKKLFILALFVASLSAVKSQVSISMPIGVSSLKTPTMGLNLQLQIHHLILVSGFDHQVSQKADKGTLYWARMGGKFYVTDLNSLEITGGMGKLVRSTDQKNLNEGLAVVNIQYVHNMKYHPEASSFVGITGTKKFTILTVGLRLTFLKREGNGCPASRIR